MPIAQRKVIEILIEEVRKVEPRCQDYSDLLTETISDIIEAERQHSVRGTNIQQLITEKCKAGGEDLNRRQSHT